MLCQDWYSRDDIGATSELVLMEIPFHAKLGFFQFYLSHDEEIAIKHLTYVG